MANDQNDDNVQQLKGALEVLDILREEFSQWMDEAQNDSKHEALDNVMNHVAAIEDEYQRRLREATSG